MENNTLNQQENQKENNNNYNSSTNYDYISENGNRQINRKGKKLTVHGYYKIQTEKYLEGLKQKQEQATTESEQLANSFEAPNTCDTSSQILQNDSEVFQRNKNKKHSTKQYYKGKVLELVQKYAKKEKTLQSHSNCSDQITCKQVNNEINEQQLAQQINQNQEQISLSNNEYQQAIKIKNFQENIKIEQFINLEIVQCDTDQVIQNQNQNNDQHENQLEQLNQLVVLEKQQLEYNLKEQIIETQQQVNSHQELNTEVEVNLNSNNLIEEENIIVEEKENQTQQIIEQIQIDVKENGNQTQQIIEQIQIEQQVVQIQNLENQQEKEEEELNEFLNKNLNTANENPPSQTVSALKCNRRNQSINKQQKQERQVQFLSPNLENDEQEKRNKLILGQNEGIKLDLSKLNAINKQEYKKRRLETQSANSKRSIRSNWTTKTFKEKAEEVAMPAVGTAVVGSLGLFLAKNVLKGKNKLLGIVPALACSAYYYYKIKKQNEVEEEIQDEIQDDEDINSDEEEQEDDSTKLQQ